MQVLAEISYKKLAQIGAGQGMNSTVWLADDPQLRGRMAVKEIEKAHLGNDPARYFLEAAAMFQVAHDNVIPIQYACQTSTLICLAMPYYHSGSLSQRIHDRPLRLREALRVAQGVLSGLARIHLAGYIHFDIKPSNVLFDDIDNPMVADFGQSRSISSTGVVKAPPLYLHAFPPETARTGVATKLADIYQVGLLLYRALNGDEWFNKQAPLDQDVLMKKIKQGKFPDRNRFMPHVPKRLRTLVRKALRIDPAERFQSATEMANALSSVSLPLDWLTEPMSRAGFRWRASRPGQADLVVDLTNQSPTWSIQTFTEKTGEPRRATGKSEHWRNGLSLEAAHAHLKGVFERLQ